jgi:KUP system potassium uptake protein
LPALALGALGIVFGDIGTSPLYALRESFHASHGLAPTPENVLGILSLIFWALVVVISVKYLAFILRADNQGEGGILALTSLLIPPTVRRGSGRWLLILLGLFGTSLLYGDGIITPAISVLSAVEGLEVATPFFEPFILPITIGILVALFAVQRFGTAGVGRVFGPVMLLWFLMLALLGIIHIVQAPGVLGAVNPAHALAFFLENGWRSFLVLGSVFLVVTGGEALYADMGHFGRQPIQLVWFVAVLPALLLNYLGQGALILRVPEAAENPFYGMIPVWGLYPAVILATMATVIASQALISGAFSLTMQAVQLGYAPYTYLRHTSAHSYGQIYIPTINWLLMFACIGLVLGFRSSSNLAAAYGAGVSTDMVITTILFYFVARERLRWPLLVALPLCLFFLIIDGAFFAANIVKIPQGGWFPYLVAVAVFTLLTTWKRGRAILAQRLDVQVTPLEVTLKELREHPPVRVLGTAVYLFRDPKGTPFSFAQNLKVNKVLHERVIFLSVKTENAPRVKLSSRITSDDLGDNFHQVVLHYGFMESPNVAGALRNLKLEGKKLDTDEVTYFLGRETLLASEHPGMAIWREKLFSVMARNAVSASVYYHLPASQVVELGTRVEL